MTDDFPLHYPRRLRPAFVGREGWPSFRRSLDLYRVGRRVREQAYVQGRPVRWPRPEYDADGAWWDAGSFLFA